MPRLIYVMVLLLAVAFAIATGLQAEARTWRSRTSSGGLMGMLLGDSRQMFANHFTAKADQYFHSGYYPSIFDNRPSAKEEAPGHVHDEHSDHDQEPVTAPASAEAQKHDHSVEACEDETGGWNKPHDWIARFGRNFRVSEHTHLGGTDRREMLPWLRISAELDPHQINTYLVGSYWLRQVNKSAAAEKFIREGLDANPRNSELFVELALIYLQDRQNPVRAYRLFELALQGWDEFERPKEKPNLILLANITSNLARLDEANGDLTTAIGHLERARLASPQPEAIARQIEELKLRLNSPAGTNAPPNR